MNDKIKGLKIEYIILDGVGTTATELFNDLHLRHSPLKVTRERIDIASTLKNRSALCSVCKQELNLSHRADTWYFKHKAGTDPCELKDDKDYQRKAAIYNGEKKLHKETKEKVAAYFERQGYEVKVEKRFYAYEESKQYKQPDVFIDELNLAIEIQNSWLPPNQIEEREQYYLKAGKRLAWIFVPGKKKSKITMNDMLYGYSSHGQVITFVSSGSDLVLDVTYRLIGKTTPITERVTFNDNRRTLLDGELLHFRLAGNEIDIIDTLSKVANEQPEAKAFISSLVAQIEEGRILSDKQRYYVDRFLLRAANWLQLRFIPKEILQANMR